MLGSVKVTMIAFTAFVVETDDASTVLFVKQSILEQLRATRNGLRHFSDNDLDDCTVWQNSLERSISTAAIMLSFMPSLWFVVDDGNGGERGLYGIFYLYILN